MGKLLVAGGRNFELTKDGYSILDDLHKKYKFDTNVNGMAKGIDWCARMWAIYNKVRVQNFYPDWGQYGKSAGPKRNKEMVNSLDDGDVAVFFKGGSGTLNCLGYALDRKNIIVFNFTNKDIFVTDKHIIQLVCNLCNNPICDGLDCVIDGVLVEHP